MTINDEILSAFLDAELPEAQMQAVREQLLTDDSLADRLAALASVDGQLRQHAQLIDEHPLPAAISQLLAEDTQDPQVVAEFTAVAPAITTVTAATADFAKAATSPASSPTTAKIIQFPRLHRLQQQLQQHAAAAAMIAFVAGYGGAQLLQQPQDKWQPIAKLLEQQASGQQITLDAEQQFTAQLSFVDQQGNYCRQYLLRSAQQQSQQLACRTGNSWQLIGSVLQSYHGGADYQTAAGHNPLDPLIDQLIQGSAFTLAEEQELIGQGWLQQPILPKTEGKQP